MTTEQRIKKLEDENLSLNNFLKKILISTKITREILEKYERERNKYATFWYVLWTAMGGIGTLMSILLFIEFIFNS